MRRIEITGMIDVGDTGFVQLQFLWDRGDRSIRSAVVLRMQDYRTADAAIATIPQKLELHKTSIAYVDHPGYFDSPHSTGYFAKRSEENDTANSILYLGPPKQDTFDLNLPKPQETHLNFRASAHRPLPLFGIKQ